MKETNEHISIEDYIKTIETISNELKERGEMTLNEYNSYNIIKRKIHELQEESSKTKDGLGSGAFNFDLNLNKLKTLLEKIQSDIQNKKEYEFISNYFISENNPGSSFDLSLSTNDSNSNKDTLANDLLHSPITDQLISNPGYNNLNAFNSIGDILRLTSPLFLSQKAKLSDEVINKIKGNSDMNSNNQNSNHSDNINQSKEVNEDTSMIKKKSDKTLLPIINKGMKSTLNASTSSFSNSNSTPNAKEKLDKEIEEEINNQIFKYTKNMKENAKAFNAKLKQDNKTIFSIEDIQTRDQDKTDTQHKRLKEFNYTLSIGFFRLIMMFLVAIVAFIFTLLIMRIFPKFA